MTEREKLAKFEQTWKPVVWMGDRGWILEFNMVCRLFMQHSEITSHNHYCPVDLITGSNTNEIRFLFQRDDPEATLSEILEDAAQYALEKAMNYLKEKSSRLMCDARTYAAYADKVAIELRKAKGGADGNN